MANLSSLPDPEKTALGIVTQPSVCTYSFLVYRTPHSFIYSKVTRKLLEEANRLNIRMTWIQPDAEDSSVVRYIREAKMEDRVIYSTGARQTISPANQEPDGEGSAQNHVHFDAGTGPPCGSDARPDIITNGNNFAP